MEVKWNRNGNWLLTASRDHLLKLFDIRKMNQEMQTFRGHKKEACSLAWHPIHETLFASGGSDGAVMFWMVGADKEVGAMENAHDSCVWSLAWHPLGHILCSGSNDHTSKFWTRNRPGDRMRDKYNLNTLPRGLDDTGEYVAQWPRRCAAELKDKGSILAAAAVLPTKVKDENTCRNFGAQISPEGQNAKPSTKCPIVQGQLLCVKQDLNF